MKQVPREGSREAAACETNLGVPLPFRFVILMAPLFGAGGPMHTCSAHAAGDCTDPPAAKGAGHQDDTAVDYIKN
jgi:hypothetical protein